MFFRKKYHKIKWDSRSKQEPVLKLKVAIKSVTNTDRKKLFGLSQPVTPISHMQIMGDILNIEVMKTDKDFSRMPSMNRVAINCEINNYHLKEHWDWVERPLDEYDTLIFWLSEEGKCFKITPQP